MTLVTWEWFGNSNENTKDGFSTLNLEPLESPSVGHLETFMLSVPRVAMLGSDPDGSSNESILI